MKILVVDDEPLARVRCMRLLEELGEYHCVGEAENAEQALQQIKALEPDVVLLDIEMPGMNGLSAAARISTLKNPPAVVFTTAYAEHALDAFDAQAVGYVLKPIRRDKLQHALQRASTLRQGQQMSRQVGNETPSLSQVMLRVHYSGGYRQLPLAQVLYLTALKKYVLICTEQEEILVEDSLKALHQQHPESLVRIHRNTLVVGQRIDRLERGEGGQYVVVHGLEQTLEVSRRHLASVRRFIREGVVAPP